VPPHVRLGVVTDQRDHLVAGLVPFGQYVRQTGTAQGGIDPGACCPAARGLRLAPALARFWPARRRL
jgi:hypothetical protein